MYPIIDAFGGGGSVPGCRHLVRKSSTDEMGVYQMQNGLRTSCELRIQTAWLGKIPQ